MTGGWFLRDSCSLLTLRFKPSDDIMSAVQTSADRLRCNLSRLQIFKPSASRRCWQKTVVGGTGCQDRRFRKYVSIKLVWRNFKLKNALFFHSDVSNQILDLYESCPNVNAIKGEGTAVGGKLVPFQTMNVEAPFAFLFFFSPQLTNWNYYL